MDELYRKKEALEAILRDLGSVAVAYSSGVDSTFLLKVAHELLGDRAAAITAVSCLIPETEAREAEAFCRREGIRHVILRPNPLAIEGFPNNPPNRCYLCKRAIFSEMRAAAAKLDAAELVEGSNLDDLGDYRPGMAAIAELGVRSPLREAGLTKAEIRALSRELGLDTWDKPSFACLASRIPYGETITAEKLVRVERAEERLRSLGLRQLRVRVHGDLARIEVEPEDFPKLLASAGELDRYFRELGFFYATLDLGGYSMGSMNRVLG